MDEDSNKKFKFSDIVTNKQYRAIIILVFYFFLFLVLIISIRSMDNKNVSEKENNQVESSSKIDGFSYIKSSNFNYNYNLTVDNNTFIYEGKKYDKNDEFSLMINNEKKDYIINDGYTFEKKNKDNILRDKPYYYIDFFQPEVIEKILINSKKIDDNNYVISNSKLDSVVDSEIGIDSDLDNYLKVYYQNNVITKIEFDYTNYVNYCGVKVGKVLLVLQYYDFGLVEKFDIKN